jgi:diguanylate cyclase (GGDEF)-like protein
MRTRSLVHLVALGVLAVAATLVVGAVALRESEEHKQLEADHEQALIALDGLTDAQLHQGEVSVTFIGLLAETTGDPTILNATVDHVTQLSVATQEAWARFTDAALDLPGESELRSTFETGYEAGTASGTELGAVVLGTVSQGSPDAAALTIRLDAVRAITDSSQRLLTALSELIELYQNEVATTEASIHADESVTATNVTWTTAAAIVALAAAWTLAMRSSARRGRIIAAERREREVEAGRNELDARLQRGLVMATDETACLDVVGMALQELDLESTEVLVADSSRAHFHQVVSPTGETSHGCGVATPNDCPAARTGQTQSFARSDSIDACPYLRQHAKGSCSAVCAPINIAGMAVGVMSATGRHGELAGADAVANLELVARKTGERLGALRTFSKSEIQARTDALTGLLNRRSIESEALAVVESGAPYAVAFGDLDHFKQLNDVFGHDTGDRALRLFARVLRDSVRPQDLPARYGGEEFVVILPGCSAADAVRVVERVRERLAESLDGGSTPPFTVSFGVAADDSGLPFADLVSMADAALLTAKADGRDRTVIGGSLGAPLDELDAARMLAPVPDRA